ncbi:unnamed protein product [Nesidiocoris tenuis]|uniref:Uncharacterized protein n=1 Tax=Nesidiocoris tenuis TaxID=355587 RepID=A0A6H5HSC9_9HEMI|nr:unnamed protein product [Nesidiocoris tenuis]
MVSFLEEEDNSRVCPGMKDSITRRGVKKQKRMLQAKDFVDLQSAMWNYHETGHGKGAPDGVGATVKRTADKAVAEGSDVVDIETLVTVLRNRLRNVEVRVIGSSSIENAISSIPTSLRTFKGTMEVHQIAWRKGDVELYMNKLTCFACPYKCKLKNMIGTQQCLAYQTAGKIGNKASGSKKKKSKKGGLKKSLVNPRTSEENHQQFSIHGINYDETSITPGTFATNDQALEEGCETEDYGHFLPSGLIFDEGCEMIDEEDTI